MKLFGREIKLSIGFRRERRRAERIALHETLYLDYQNSFRQIRGSGEGKNLSLAGILFATSSALPVGSFLELVLHLYPAFTPSAPIRLQGRVVRSFQTSAQEHHRIAFEFEPPEKHTAKILESFLERIRTRNKKDFYR